MRNAVPAGVAGTGSLGAESGPGPTSPTAVHIVDEVDAYTSAAAGVQIESIRTGEGVGPNRLVTTRGDGFVATGVRTGFPLLGRTTLGDDEVAIATIRAAPPGAKFCEIDLEPGMVLCYGPGAEHTGVNPVGYEFVFAVTTRRELATRAQVLGQPLDPPAKGQVRAMAATPEVIAMGRSLSGLETAAAAGVDPASNREHDLMREMVAAFAQSADRTPTGSPGRVDDRHVALTCIEYASSIERIPTVNELCMVAHVCQRRLQLAFNRTFDMPPTHFFRAWAMDQARRRLLAAEPGGGTVTAVATGLGFAHLARFAGRYRARFGEAPSQTLRRRVPG